MKDSQLELNGKPQRADRDNQMLVRDISRYLTRLARLNELEKTGNPDLSEGLRQVVDALRLYATCPVHELASTLKEAKSTNTRRVPLRKIKVNLPPNLESMCKEDIEKILNDDRFTKAQVAELGFQRFGISRSTLERLRKEDALRSVRAALEHEKSLDVISRQARKSGTARAS